MRPIDFEEPIERRIDLDLAIGESPVWDAARRLLWFVDILAPCIYALDPQTDHLTTYPMPCAVGSIGLANGGRLVVALRSGVHLFDPVSRTLEFLVHPEPGMDMNRLWDADRLAALRDADPATLRSEERRVRQLAPVVLGCDVILDLHSTSRPSPPHLLFRDDLAHVQLARRLGVARLVTGIHENGVLEGAVCSNAGLSPGEPSERLGFTPAPKDPMILIGHPAVIATRFRLTGETWRSLNPPTA